MFDRERYLEAILSQPNGGDRLADLVLSAKLIRNPKNHSKQEKTVTVNVLDGLCEHAQEHILLLGKPGSGKSTALKGLLREEAEKCLQNTSQLIPVLLELRRLDKNTKIEDLLAKALSVPRYRVKPDNITDLLDEYRFLLLFDGLNEMSSSSELYDWRKEFPHVPMIFTSRELGAETYLNIDVRLYILPLTEGQAKEFIEKKLVDHNSASQMWQALQGRIKELTDTPLLLDMLCSTYKNSKTIPQNRGKLFRQFTRDEYPKYKPSDSITLHSDDFPDFCNDVLQELAFFMMDAGGNEKHLWLQIERDIAKNNLQRHFSNEAGSKVNDWLRDSLKFHLLQYTENENKIEFTHQLFQEYYAAEWLIQNINDLSDDQLCVYHLNPIKWTESILMAMDLISEKSQATRIVEQALDVDINLGAKISGRVQTDWQEKMFKILNSYLESKNFNEYAIIKLIEINQTEYAAKKIIKFLEKNEIVSTWGLSENEWRMLFEVATSIKFKDSVNYIVNTIKKEHFRYVIIFNQVQYNSFPKEKIPNGHHIYIDEKFSGEKPERREITLKALNNIKWQAMSTLWKWREFDNFLKLLPTIVLFLPKNEESYDIIPHLASYRYGKDALLEIIKLLEKRIESYHPPRKPSIKYNGFLVLRRVATESLGYFIDDIDIVDFLINLLDDRDYGVCCIAARILGKVNSERPVDILVRIVCSGINYDNYNNNSSKISNDDDDDDLNKQYNPGYYNAKHLFNEATNSLGRISPYIAEEKLLSLLAHHSETEKRVLCINALGIIACRNVIPEFIKYSQKNYDFAVRQEAVYALGLVGSENEIQHLIEILHDDDIRIKQKSIDSLGVIIKKKTIENTTSLIVESLFLELDIARKISEDIFREYKRYENILNKGIGKKSFGDIFSQECSTNHKQYAKHAQYINSILATLEYIATKYTTHNICVEIIDFVLKTISTGKNIETRSLVLHLLGQIPHYKAIEKWLEEARHDEKYTAEWSKLINELSRGGNRWPSVYPNAYKYPQEMNYQFTSKDEKDRFNLAIDKLEDFHSQHGNFYRRGMGIIKEENTSYASAFCEEENITKIFQELISKKIDVDNHKVKSIIRYCPNYQSKIIEWISNNEPELRDPLYILYGAKNHNSLYLEEAHAALLASDFPWPEILVDAVKEWPEFLPRLKYLAFENTDSNHKLSFLYVFHDSQNHHGYYSYEWLKKSKTTPKYPSTKEVNMAGTTINFNAPINQYGNGTLTGDVTNNNYEEKRQAESRALILTEGKTDPIHLEYALKRLQKAAKFTNLKIEFASTKAEGKEGATETMRRCTDASIIFPNRTIIGLFDRDNKKSIPELKDKETHSLHALHPVYIAKIPQIEGLSDEIAIENYYSQTDLERTDTDGRKLKIEDGYKIKSPKTGENRQFLSKKDFAENVINEREGFKDIDVSNFAKIFELIEHIIEEAKKPK